jgi:hypothetical protein
MVIGKHGRNINWMRDHFKAAYAQQFGVEVEVHARVVVRRKQLTRGFEQVEGSYHLQAQQQQMHMLREQL